MNANNWRVEVHRRKRRNEAAGTWWRVTFTGWLIASGGASGILLGVIALNWLQPGNPYYSAVQTWLRQWF